MILTTGELKPMFFENLSATKKPLWTVAIVARFLNVSEATIRDWVYKRKIPFLKFNSCLRFSPDEIESWALKQQGVS